jgi:tetratricopeptide (TPR) repeat protein
MLANLLRSILPKSQAGPTPEQVAAAEAQFQQRNFAAAEAVFAAMTRRTPGDGRMWLRTAVCAYELGRHEEALDLFAKARELQPGDGQTLYDEAVCLAQLERYDEARARFRHLLDIHPWFDGARFALAKLDLPGPDYFANLERQQQRLAPRTYLEIGVFTGRTLRFAGPDTQAIGVDPDPKLQFEPPPSTKVYQMTSDDFFAQHDVRALFGGRSVELGFIDGMHHFEFALRDFINMERLMSPGGTILIHDCYPLDALSAARTYREVFWSGDIWRLTLILKKYRPDLALHTLAWAPTGMGFVRNLDPASTVLFEHYDAIVAEFAALDYSVLDADKPGMLNLFPNDAERIDALFDGRG